MNDATHSSQVQTINDYRDSVEPQLAFVGLFDVLGFKSRLSDHGLDEVRSGYRQLVDRKVDAGVVPVFSGAGGTYRRLATTIFSDTILLWCIDEWEAVQTLEDVVEYPVPVKDGHHALTHALHWCPYSSRASVELDASFVNVQF